MKNEKERTGKTALKRFMVGVGLAGGDTAINYGLSMIGSAESLTIGIANSSIADHRASVLLGTMAIGLGASALISLQNLRLNHEFGVSPNGIGTLIFNVMDKKWPAKTKLRDRTVGISQVLLTKDWFLVAPALVNDKVLGAFATAQALKTGYALIKLLSEAVLRKTAAKKKKEKTEIVTEKKQLFPKGIIFALAEVKNNIFPK
jgi:hypothetical protein